MPLSTFFVTFIETVKLEIQLKSDGKPICRPLIVIKQTKIARSEGLDYPIIPALEIPSHLSMIRHKNPEKTDSSSNVRYCSTKPVTDFLFLYKETFLIIFKTLFLIFLEQFPYLHEIFYGLLLILISRSSHLIVSPG